jgi:hypothetical protein
MVLKDVRLKGDNRYLVTIGATIEQEGADQPRVAAEWLALVVWA